MMQAPRESLPTHWPCYRDGGVREYWKLPSGEVWVRMNEGMYWGAWAIADPASEEVQFLYRDPAALSHQTIAEMQLP